MNSKWIVSLLLAMVSFIAASNDASAQTRFGVRGGLYADQNEPFVGTHFLHKIQRHFIFNPNFEYVLVDRGSLYTINADFHYDLPSRSSTVFWLGGGLGISRSSFRDLSNTDTGLNLFMGVSFGRRPAIPFLQVKVLMMDDNQLVFVGGITF
jgi:hypothetical protein